MSPGLPLYDGKVHSLHLEARSHESKTEKYRFFINLYSDSPIISPGVFNASERASPNGYMGQVDLMWVPNDQILYHVTGPQDELDLSERRTGIKGQFTVAITHIDDKRIRGTFSGTAIGMPYPEGEPIPGTITNGEFDVPLADWH